MAHSEITRRHRNPRGVAGAVCLTIELLSSIQGRGLIDFAICYRDALHQAMNWCTPDFGKHHDDGKLR